MPNNPPLTALLVALKDNGFRHNWFAAQLSISKWMLSHYLAGRQVPPDRFYREAALLLRCKPDELRPAADAPAEKAA